MSEASASQMGQLQNYTVDQLAGAIALTLGAVVRLAALPRVLRLMIPYLCDYGL